MKLKYGEGNVWGEVAMKGLTIGLHPVEHYTHGMRPGKSRTLSIGGVSFSSRIEEDMAVRLALFSEIGQ